MKQAKYSLYKEGDRLTLIVDNPDEETVRLLEKVAVNGINDICNFEYEKEAPVPPDPKGFEVREIVELAHDIDRVRQYGLENFVRKAELTVSDACIRRTYLNLGIATNEDKRDKLALLGNEYYMLFCQWVKNMEAEYNQSAQGSY